MTFPNILSLLRVLIAPVFLYLITYGGFYILIAFILFVIGALTDYVDGWYARKYNVATPLGKFVDPLADKFLTTSAFLAFSIMELIPFWMVIIVIFRDFMTTVMRVFADKFEIQMKTSYPAKVKTFLQMLFISYVLLLLVGNESELFGISSYKWERLLTGGDVIYFIMLLLTLLSLWTLIEYFINNMELINRISGK